MTTSLAVREIEEHLASIRAASRGNVRRELTDLYLLALEREELATVGYGGAEMVERVARLEASTEARAAILHALRWAARDERTHAVLARGLLLSAGQLGLALRSFAAELGGLVAGWSAAVLQHTHPGQAPVARWLARAVTWLGALLGKVPETAKGTLRAQRFDEFCRFQEGAEETAAIAWERIALCLDGILDSPLAATAARIADDERKHVEMLRLFLQAFPDGDALAPGWDGARLVEGLAAISPSFVRASWRKAAASPIGRGGTVVVREDPAAGRGDPAALRALLRDAIGGVLAVPAGARVAIKTTFMMSYDRGDPSPHVDLVLAEELAILLRERGASDVAYLEAPNHFESMFQHRSVVEVARYAGFTSPHYRVVDTSDDQVPQPFVRGLGQDSVCRTWRDADLRIVFAKMRTNPSWLVHLTTQNLESLGRPLEEMLFHDRSADLTSGLMMMLDALPPPPGAPRRHPPRSSRPHRHSRRPEPEPPRPRVCCT